MIKNKIALSMAEAAEYVGKSEEGETDVIGFIKKFIKLKPKEAKELRAKLGGLELMKMREEHIVKIIDLLPEDSETLNKIFVDVGLDEDETNKILDTVKEYK